ncbi:mitochondrial splicing system protein [Lobaria immixta]|nr:mitochondrial splicing system protein [Lobaria immixta]
MADRNIESSGQLRMNDDAGPGLASLPPEVQGMIASFLLRPTDLNALSRTCKTLRDTVLPKLYRRVEVRIPAGPFLLDAFENLLSSSGDGLNSTQELRILPQQGPLHDGDQINLDIGRNIQRCQRPCCLRLEGFTVDPIRTLEFATPADLEELRFGSLELNQIDWMADLVATNSTTLQHLEMGAESTVRDCRRNDSFTKDNNSNVQLTQQFRQELDKYLVTSDGFSWSVLSVRSLTLVGLSLLALDDSQGRSIIDWTTLRDLALKSCSQLDRTLALLQSAMVRLDGSWEGVNLESFDLRSDNRANPALVADALKDFLTSFSGLVHLSLLIEDPVISASMLTAILKSQGSTLRRLIWDVRMQERTSFMTDLSRANSKNKHLVFISKQCPLLEELGLSFDWPALVEPHGREGTLINVAQNLKSLRHLRTLHIRNLPPLGKEDGRSTWPGVSDDERSEGFVLRLLRAMMRYCPELPPNLETIALGILRYKDVCAGKAARHDNERLDEFLKLRVYHVEYQRNFQGDYIPIITFIAKGTADAIQDTCPKIKILQSYWMA